jgi:hypothetical protein
MLPAPEKSPESVATYIQQASPELAMELSRSLQLWNWFVTNLHALKAPNTVRARMAVSMLQVAADHQAAVVSLLNTQWTRAASALALVRPAVEAMMMGVWVLHVATDDHLAQIGARRATPPNLSKLLRMLDRCAFAAEPLYPVLEESIPALDGFTHGGIWHMESRQNGQRVGANYTTRDLIAGLRLADLVMVMAALEMAQLAGDESRSARMYREGRQLLGLNCEGANYRTG